MGFLHSAVQWHLRTILELVDRHFFLLFPKRFPWTQLFVVLVVAAELWSLKKNSFLFSTTYIIHIGYVYEPLPVPVGSSVHLVVFMVIKETDDDRGTKWYLISLKVVTDFASFLYNNLWVHWVFKELNILATNLQREPFVWRWCIDHKKYSQGRGVSWNNCLNILSSCW